MQDSLLKKKQNIYVTDINTSMIQIMIYIQNQHEHNLVMAMTKAHFEEQFKQHSLTLALLTIFDTLSKNYFYGDSCH